MSESRECIQHGVPLTSLLCGPECVRLTNEWHNPSQDDE